MGCSQDWLFINWRGWLHEQTNLLACIGYDPISCVTNSVDLTHLTVIPSDHAYSSGIVSPWGSKLPSMTLWVRFPSSASEWWMGFSLFKCVTLSIVFLSTIKVAFDGRGLCRVINRILGGKLYWAAHSLGIKHQCMHCNGSQKVANEIYKKVSHFIQGFYMIWI